MEEVGEIRDKENWEFRDRKIDWREVGREGLR